jgi:hypothetical protein
MTPLNTTASSPSSTGSSPSQTSSPAATTTPAKGKAVSLTSAGYLLELAFVVSVVSFF